MEDIKLKDVVLDWDDFRLSEITFFQSMDINGETWFLAGSGASGAVTSFRLDSTGAAQLEDIEWLENDLGPLSHNGGFLVETGDQDRLITLSRLDGNVMTQTVDNGMLSAGQQLLDNHGQSVSATIMTDFNHAGQTFLLGAGGDAGDLTLYAMGQNGRVAQSTQIASVGTNKASVEGITDMLEIASGGHTFIVSSSNTDNSLNSYQMNDAGQLEFVDRVTAADGMWVSGLDGLTVIEQDGQAFVLGVSAAAGAMVSVRMNPMGVFFVSDVVYDSRDTRFDGATAIDSFGVDDRNFVLSGGSDQGLTLFELMDDGSLFHHSSIAQDNDWHIGNVQAIETIVQGDTLEILVSGSATGGIAQLTLNLADIGVKRHGTDAADTIAGTTADDFLFGGAGDDFLSGGAGDDILFANQGQDQLTGGEGNDMFVFEADGISDNVQDFQLGQDQLHLGGWGRLYDYRDLSISSHENGAKIRWHDEELTIVNADGGSIDPNAWTSNDFVF